MQFELDFDMVRFGDNKLLFIEMHHQRLAAG